MTGYSARETQGERCNGEHKVYEEATRDERQKQGEPGSQEDMRLTFFFAQLSKGKIGFSRRRRAILLLIVEREGAGFRGLQRVSGDL
jgi:hypothetical protein